MKINSTELVFILDESGSMYGLANDTIGGFNSLIDKQKKLDEDCYVSVVLFNESSKLLYDRVKIESVNKMTERDYCPNGSTSLYDAVGDAINHISNIHKYIRPEDVPEKTLFVITTDGYENSSNKFTSKKLKQLIEDKKANDNWEFMFLGANIDSQEVANDIGINEDMAVNYCATPAGTSIMYDSIEKSVYQLRECGKINKDWKDDFNK